ncbi:MAG: hypothetical protein R3D98_01160 [Candidatus Krumholzibacteriia bacterium]
MPTWRTMISMASLTLVLGLLAPQFASAAEDAEAEDQAGHWGTELKLGINLL